MEKLAKQKDCVELKGWIKSIGNHMYWTALSSKGDGDEVKKKWISMIEHIQNTHTNCSHTPLNQSERKKPWLKPHSKAITKIEEKFLKSRFLNDLAKISPCGITSSLESYHRVILMFAPKLFIFKYKGMLARLTLASMHFNEQTTRKQRVNKKGQPEYTYKFIKWKKGECRIRKEMEPPTYSYVDELLSMLFSEVVLDNTESKADWDSIVAPPSLCSDTTRLSKDELVKKSKEHTRFACSTSNILTSSSTQTPSASSS